MAMAQDSLADTVEQCSTCDATTPHAVTLQLVTESGREENSQFSREPYRVSECQVCGSTERIRMNNA